MRRLTEREASGDRWIGPRIVRPSRSIGRLGLPKNRPRPYDVPDGARAVDRPEIRHPGEKEEVRPR
jgi:hypothetical protein